MEADFQAFFLYFWQFLIGSKKDKKKSERAGPHQIGQKGQLVKRSLGPKS